MNIPEQVTEWGIPLAIAAATVLAVILGAVIVRRFKTGSEQTGRRKFSAGTVAAVVAFIVCTSVSLNTSFRFTKDGLGMTGEAERILSCAAFEALIAMCVLGARERLSSEAKSPGWYGSAVWVLAALSAVPAWHEGGGLTAGTIVRIIIGSFGSALAAHSALGLELRHRTGDESQSPMAQIARDLRERLMARLGLSHRNRTAQQIARDRALDEAVDLRDEYDRLPDTEKKGKAGVKLARKLARALDRAGCAEDEEQQRKFRARVALRRYATELEITPDESPLYEHGTAPQDEKTVAMLDQRIRHIEDLADQAEGAILAHAAHPARAEDQEQQDDDGIRAAAATHGTGRRHVTARLPFGEEGADDDHQEQQEGQAEPPALDLTHYPTKRAALEALYAARISPDDTRTTNAITVELLAELKKHGIRLDRGSANRWVGELRTPAEGEEPTATDRQDEPADRELANA
ncbi:hypothetical protein [Streptomyces atacamensis]|uniref:hypothetical protein n=1 Tax=Streptomyces atacamensis TaxID=531966 RepID=UPI00399C5D2F